MPPHVAQQGYSRRRSKVVADDEAHEVVHVKRTSPPRPSPHSSSSAPKRPASTGPPLGADRRNSLRSTTKRARLESSSVHPSSASSSNMPAVVKDSNPTPRVSRAKKGKRVHACTHAGCEKIFTRAEHLRRHQLNHNTDVFFKCDMCDRTFVRQDLLVRHQERHQTQAIKAVQTLALAQRHRGFSAHYNINGLNSLSPNGENDHGFNDNPNQHNVPGVHDSITVSSPNANLLASLNLPANFNNNMGISHGSDSSVGYASTDSTPSPSGSIGQGQLPYQMNPGDIRRQQESYLSHTEMIQRQNHNNEQGPQFNNLGLSSWESNISWLLDDQSDKPMMDGIHIVPYIHPLEMAYSRSIAHPPPELSSAPLPPGVRDTSPLFHLMDENTRSEILLLLGNVPSIEMSNFASLEAMQHYLRLYWNNFHPLYPILHRPSFVPGYSMVCLAAIVIALGASFADNEAHQFGMALYDKVKALLVNSNDYSATGPNNLPILQTLMLTDIFGKMRTTREQFDDVQLDMILSGLMKREGPPADAAERLRNLQRDGLDYHLESEWHHWIMLEGRKRMTTLFSYYDAQQAVVFGREACQTAFEFQCALPSGKDEVLWESDCASDWITRIDTTTDQTTFLASMRTFFNQKKPLPHLSPLAMVFILHGLISIALDLKADRERNPEGSMEKQAKLMTAFERWRQHYEKTVAIHLRSPCHNKIMVMYHMAFVTMHTNLHHLYTVAGDTRNLSRSSERIDYMHARNELAAWADSPVGQLATWHAIQIIVRMLGEPALVREQVHMPWMQYACLLTCWAYGHFSTSPLAGAPGVASSVDVLWDSHAAQAEMQQYLTQMNTRTWQEMAHSKNYRLTGGVIAVVKGTWEEMRWGMLDQCKNILNNIITRPQANVKPGVAF